VTPAKIKIKEGKAKKPTHISPLNKDLKHIGFDLSRGI
jgi:hypothetical protein